MHNDETPPLTNFSNNSDPTVLFIGGMPRSGTTLLSDLLGFRPEVGLFVELGFQQFLMSMEHLFSYHHLLHGTGKESPAEPSSGEVVALSYEHSSAAPALSTAPVFELRQNKAAAVVRRYPSPDRKSALAKAIFQSALDKSNLRIIGCKDPLFYIDHRNEKIAEDFPGIKYIFMIRSPKGQINSSINRRNLAKIERDSWHIKSVKEAIDEYVYYLSVACSYISNDKLDCMIVIYENLLEGPDGELARIGEFLQIDNFRDVQEIIGAKTEEIVLSDHEVAQFDARLGELSRAWPSIQRLDQNSLVKALSVGLRPVSGEMITYQGGSERRYLGAGWSNPDVEGVWTSSEWADLVFVGEGEWILSASVVPYLPKQESRLWVTIELNGGIISKNLCTYFDDRISKSQSDVEFNIIGMAGRSHHQLWIGPIRLAKGSVNIIRFRFAGAVPPSECGGGPDPRLCGFKIQSLQMIKNSLS